MIIQHKATFDGHLGAIYALSPAFQTDYFYSGAADGFLVKWELNHPETGKVLFKLDSPIYAICKLDEHSMLLAIGTANGNLTVFDMESNQLLVQLKAHEGAIFDLKIVGDKLLSAGADGLVIGWFVKDFKKHFQLNFATVSARVIAPGIDNNQFYVGYSDQKIRSFVGIDEPILKHTLAGSTHSVFALAVHPLNGHLVSGGRDAHLRFWQQHQLVHSVAAHMLHVNSLCFQPAAHFLASGSMDKSIKIWNPETAKLLKVIDSTKPKFHKHSVNKLCWLSDSLLLSASDDRSILLWEIQPNEEN